MTNQTATLDRASEAGFRSISADTGEPFGEPFAVHGPADVDAACAAAEAAFDAYRSTDRETRAAFLEKIGEEITEVLEYEPGELFVKQYKRIKYAKPDNAGVIIGELPSRPIEKAMAGEGLLAQIVIDKYVDHLPLHRQMQRFERAGVKLAYSTLTDWVSGTCNLITPLFEALKAEVLQSGSCA